MPLIKPKRGCMRIGINARYLQKEYTGIENYLLQLLLNLNKATGDNEYFLFFGNDGLIPEALKSRNFKNIISKIPCNNQITKIIWSHFYLPFLARRFKLDVFHEPLFIAPLFKQCPTVITVYDLAFLRLPDCYTYRNKLYLKTLLSKSIKEADAVIAISESTKKDILDNFGSSEKLHTVYGGVSLEFKRIDDHTVLEKVKRIYKIEGDFVLTASLITPRKNMVRLIRAFRSLRERSNYNYKLVIAGGKGWGWEAVYKEAVDSGYENDIIFCGYVPDEHLIALYNLAKIFVYPSLYEGFGLPALEGMACGCPVITSRISSLPEVCADAALFVDPYDTEELSHSIEKLLKDQLLRQTLILKGYQQANKFSWQRAAGETLAIYERVASKKHA